MRLREFLVLENKEDDLEIANNFIDGWIYDSDYYRNNFESKLEIQKEFTTTLKCYPCRSGVKIYRGFAFRTEVEIEKFRNATNNFTTITDPKPTSWSRYIEQAYAFARMDMDGNKDEQDEGEPDIGVVISMKTSSKNAIDALKSEVKIDEVIVGPLVNVKINFEKRT